MDKHPSGDEVFQVAMELEETGEVFYEALAATSQNSLITSMCRRLARDEVNHYRIFEEMRANRAGYWPTRDLDSDELRFTQSLINERVIPSAEKMREIVAAGSIAETLELAIKMEDDSITFYEELVAGADDETAESLRKIIGEENRHKQDLIDARSGL